MTAAFIAATGLCWILMFGGILAWLRNLLYKLAFLRRMLVCSLCTGTWCGLLFMVDPAFRVWWFPLGCAATAWISTLAIYRITGIDPGDDTGREGERYTRRWAMGTWDCVQIVESNLFYIQYRDVDSGVLDHWRVMARESFDAVYDHRIKVWNEETNRLDEVFP